MALSARPCLADAATQAVPREAIIALDVELGGVPIGIRRLTVDSALDLALRLIGSVARLRRQPLAS